MVPLNFFWLVGLVLWHINLYRLFNAKSIFMQIVLFQTLQFSMSTQFNCQKHFYFKQISLGWLVGFYGMPTHRVILCRKRLLFLFGIIFMRIVI